MLKIHTKQNIHFQFTNEKVQAQRISMILKLSLNTRIMSRIIPIKALKNTTQIKNVKYQLFLMI